MSYGNKDPRSRMAPTAVGGAEPCAAPQFFDFSVLEPEVSELGSRTWWVRGQNFALAYTVAQPGEVLSRHAQPDEYVVLFARDPAEAVFCARGERAEVDAASLIVVPPGPSTTEIVRESHVVRLFSAASPELLEKCRNHEAYTEPHANVAPFEAWPDPVSDYRLRVYPIADYPYQQGRFARVFRCSTFMVNVFDPDREPVIPQGSRRTRTTTSSNARWRWTANTSITFGRPGRRTFRPGAPMSTPAPAALRSRLSRRRRSTPASRSARPGISWSTSSARPAPILGAARIR